MTGVTGYQLKGAKTSLNIMFQEWSNRGFTIGKLQTINYFS